MVFRHIPYLLVVVKDITPVVFHEFHIAVTFDLTSLETVEHSKLWLEDCIDCYDIFSCNRYSLNDSNLFASKEFLIKHLQFKTYLLQKIERFLHQFFNDTIKENIGSCEFFCQSIVVAFAVFIKQLAYMPAFSFQSDDIILAPEELHFFWKNEFVLSVKIRIL